MAQPSEPRAPFFSSSLRTEVNQPFDFSQSRGSLGQGFLAAYPSTQSTLGLHTEPAAHLIGNDILTSPLHSSSSSIAAPLTTPEQDKRATSLIFPSLTNGTTHPLDQLSTSTEHLSAPLEPPLSTKTHPPTMANHNPSTSVLARIAQQKTESRVEESTAKPHKTFSNGKGTAYRSVLQAPRHFLSRPS